MVWWYREWYNLFQDEFILRSNSDNDDMLFFVWSETGRLAAMPKQPQDQLSPSYTATLSKYALGYASKLKYLSSDEEEEDTKEAVFVKRKIVKPLPMLPSDVNEELVAWMDTFYLNMIVQMPCKLTVAVCQKSDSQVLLNNSSPAALLNEDRRKKSFKTVHGSMTCLNKYVSRRVFALPWKRSSDRKDSGHVCSWPDLYFSANGFDFDDEPLVLKEGEYLCVELSTMIPDSSPATIESKKSNQKSPQMVRKLILFQGAASYSSLRDIHKQKLATKQNRRFPLRLNTAAECPTEYIMMRGPSGKGCAQVALASSKRVDYVMSGFSTPLLEARAIRTSQGFTPSHARKSSWLYSGILDAVNQLKETMFGQPAQDATVQKEEYPSSFETDDLSSISRESMGVDTTKGEFLIVGPPNAECGGVEELEEVTEEEEHLKCRVTFASIRWTFIVRLAFSLLND